MRRLCFVVFGCAGSTSTMRSRQICRLFAGRCVGRFGRSRSRTGWKICDHRPSCEGRKRSAPTIHTPGASSMEPLISGRPSTRASPFNRSDEAVCAYVDWLAIVTRDEIAALGGRSKRSPMRSSPDRLDRGGGQDPPGARLTWWVANTVAAVSQGVLSDGRLLYLWRGPSPIVAEMRAVSLLLRSAASV